MFKIIFLIVNILFCLFVNFYSSLYYNNFFLIFVLYSIFLFYMYRNFRKYNKFPWLIYILSSINVSINIGVFIYKILQLFGFESINIPLYTGFLIFVVYFFYIFFRILEINYKKFFTIILISYFLGILKKELWVVISLIMVIFNILFTFKDRSDLKLFFAKKKIDFIKFKDELLTVDELNGKMVLQKIIVNISLIFLYLLVYLTDFYKYYIYKFINVLFNINTEDNLYYFLRLIYFGVIRLLLFLTFILILMVISKKVRSLIRAGFN